MLNLTPHRQEGHKSEQDRQCVHSVTLNHVHMTVATEKQ